MSPHVRSVASLTRRPVFIKRANRVHQSGSHCSRTAEISSDVSQRNRPGDSFCFGGRGSVIVTPDSSLAQRKKLSRATKSRLLVEPSHPAFSRASRKSARKLFVMPPIVAARPFGKLAKKMVQLAHSDLPYREHTVAAFLATNRPEYQNNDCNTVIATHLSSRELA
jgi:hypothetical protein